MRGARRVVYESVSDMCAAIRELPFEAHRFQDSLAAIIGSACGGDGEKGLLQARTVDYQNSPPLEWSKELDHLYEHLGPNSFLIKKIGESCNNQMTIEASLLPRCILDEFPKSGSYESRTISGLRRQATGNFSIRLWEWFWIPFISAFLEMQLDERRINVEQDIAEDDFFMSISRNTFLGLLYRNLLQLPQPLRNRLINLLHIFLIEELLFKFRKREGTNQQSVKYKLKPHYLHLLYLLVLTVQLDEETIKTYFIYLEKISENYSSTTVLSINQNIRNILRVWLTLATRSATVEFSLVQKLKLANDKQGWFRLGRCPIEQFENALDRLKTGPREIGRASSAKEGLIRLLEKTGEWQPTYSMLAVLEQYLVYQQKNGLEFQRNREEEGGILVRAIERILLAIMEQTANRELVLSIHQRLNKRIQQLYGRGMALLIDQKSLNKAISAKNNCRTNGERKRLINNQVPRKMNVWAYPLQHNEFLILYRLMHWLAEQIDCIIPGKNQEQHPRINIRIFCNPLVFILTVILIVSAIRYI